MKKLMFLLLLISSQAFTESCFLVKEKNRFLVEEGVCNKAFAPNSTFKIPLSLMGFDSGVFQSEVKPSLKYKEEYRSLINVCRVDLTPKSWMRDSCVWFSQILTQKLGDKKFTEYVKMFNYGNKNTSGGLTHSWLSSSLLITPKEQVSFLGDMLEKKFAIGPEAYEKTRKILFNQELAGGWKLYGKTGNGFYEKDLQQGWFVGWIEKDGREIVFTHHIFDQTKKDSFASFRSRNEVQIKLWHLINNLEVRK